MRFLSSLVVSIVLLSSCTTTQYHWRDYDEDLRGYYQNQADPTPLIKSLKRTVEEGIARKNLAPGLCAEYGYLLLERGDLDQANYYFNKEMEYWPESSLFIGKLIRNASKKGESVKKTEGGSIK
jgi:hypothetical protein